MTELKTLKDLASIRPDENGALVRLIDLRQEAIKWVKSNDWNSWAYFYNGHLKIEGIKAVEEWIKYFFNLTEEDLHDVAKTTEL